MLIHSSYKFDSYRIFHTSDLFQILVLCPRRNCYFPLMLSAADVFFSVLHVMKNELSCNFGIYTDDLHRFEAVMSFLVVASGNVVIR